MAEDMDIVNDEYIPQLHFYLWISHGANVSSKNNYYSLETKFRSLTFYSSPFEEITNEYLNS